MWSPTPRQLAARRRAWPSTASCATKFYGGQSYDFSENGLLATAQRAIAANKPDDALAYLQANVDYYPKSARSYLVMAQAHLAKQDKAGAIKDLEKALELDPNNAQAKTQLERSRRKSEE